MCIRDRFNAPFYGLFAMPDGVGCAVHAGAKLYFRAPDGTQTELCADMNEAFSQSFTMKGVLYLMDGKTYRAVSYTHLDVYKRQILWLIERR